MLPTGGIGATRAAALQRTIGAAGFPAVLATLIGTDGVWSGAAGVDGVSGRHAAAGDVVPIASISKCCTAALVHRLAEQGRIRLDDPLSAHLDAVAAAKANGATVR